MYNKTWYYHGTVLYEAYCAHVQMSICMCVPVRRVCALQVLLHPCISLQGRTTTLYRLSQVRSESAHTGAVSLQWIHSLPSAAIVSYNSAPRTADHEISKVSVEISDTDTSSGQHGTEDREKEVSHILFSFKTFYLYSSTVVYIYVYLSVYSTNL